MASYINNVLGRDEKITYEAKISIWSMLPLLILGFITIWFFGLGIIFFIAAYLKFISTELAITNKRVIAKFGFISRRTIEINLDRIESIQVNQGIFGRIFNYGSLVVSGAGNPQAPIPGVSEPLSFRRAFMETQEDQKSLKAA
jgi:uncharacterized membrane protein YdbT with pleckstrin-like domain